MIVDAHNHVFPEVNGRIRGGATRGAGYGNMTVGGRRTVRMFPPFNERTEFTPEMLIANLDWAGVGKAVLQQGTIYGECNQFVLDAVRRYPGRLLGALHADPWRPEYRREFDRMLATGEFSAVKIEFSYEAGLCGVHPGARLDDDGISWLWTATEKAGVPLVLDLGTAGDPSYQTDAVRGIAESRPDLRIVIAHLGQPRKQAEQADPAKWRMWQEQIALGRLPNVWFDTASLPRLGGGLPLPGSGTVFQTGGRGRRAGQDHVGHRPAGNPQAPELPGLAAAGAAAYGVSVGGRARPRAGRHRPGGVRGLRRAASTSR